MNQALARPRQRSIYPTLEFDLAGKKDNLDPTILGSLVPRDRPVATEGGGGQAFGIHFGVIFEKVHDGKRPHCRQLPIALEAFIGLLDRNIISMSLYPDLLV